MLSPFLSKYSGRMASSLTQVRLGYHRTRSRAVGHSSAASPSSLSASLTGSFPLPWGCSGRSPRATSRLHAERAARPVPAVKATAPGWLWPSVVALAPAASFSESFLSPVPQPTVSQPREPPQSIPGAGPRCQLDFHSPQLEGGQTQATCEGRTRLCRADVPAPTANFLGIGDGCPQRPLLPRQKRGRLQAVPKHAWPFCNRLLSRPAAVQVKLETIF